MAGNGWSGSGPQVLASWRCTFTPAVCALMVVVAMQAPARPAAAAAKASSKSQASKLADMSQSIAAVVEAQRSLAVQLSQLRDQLNDLQRSIDDGREEIRQNHDALQGAVDQIKGMREEVRGLYVESSGLKGDIAQVGKQVDGLDGNLSSFRLSAGIVVAAVIVLQIVLVGLTFRGRG